MEQRIKGIRVPPPFAAGFRFGRLPRGRRAWAVRSGVPRSSPRTDSRTSSPAPLPGWWIGLSRSDDLARSRYRPDEKSAYRMQERTRYRKVERSRYRPEKRLLTSSGQIHRTVYTIGMLGCPGSRQALGEWVDELAPGERERRGSNSKRDPCSQKRRRRSSMSSKLGQFSLGKAERNGITRTA